MNKLKGGNMVRKKYSYSERKSYWQGVGYGMATYASKEDETKYINKMKKTKSYTNFQNGLVYCDFPNKKKI